MSDTVDSVRKTIHKTADYKALKKQIEDLPGAAADYVRKNFSGAEGLQMGLDIVGMFEPTPFADIAGGILAVARGDWLSAGTSVLGIVPYIGDTGKIAKWAKRAVSSPKYARVLGFINDYTNIKRKMAVLTQTKALQKTRKEMWEYYQRSLKGETCEKCMLARSKIHSALPAHGSWSGPKGNSVWKPDVTTKLDPDIDDWVKREGGVPFKEGVPDYSKFAEDLPGGIRTLPMEMTGKGSDMTEAWRLLKDARSANNLPVGRADMSYLKDNFTWHHTAEGMQLVPSKLHDVVSGGPKHVGSRSILKWPDY